MSKHKSFLFRTVENVVENEYHFTLKNVDQDLSSLAMFTKHLMGKHCGGRGGGVGSNSGVGEGKVESMGGIRRVVGSFAKRSMVAKDGIGGDGLVVDGGRIHIATFKERYREDDSGGVVIGEVGGAHNVWYIGGRYGLLGGEEVFGLTKQHGLTLILRFVLD
ncbi:hypothetical protein Tco_0394223 [Tanacetum coccineum]